MNEQRTWQRIRERLELKLPVKVLCREAPDFEWKELTRLTNVTPFGTGFTLKRPTEKGRLLHITIPMPRQLRVFDHIEDQYRVWSLVRYAKKVTNADSNALFDVGVAFIGKRPPASYEPEPWRRYEISTPDFHSMPSAEDIVKPIPNSEQRVHTRHKIPVDLSLELLDEKGEVGQTETTVTENISRKGATIFTSLEVPIGRFLRLTSQQYGLMVHAAVRGCSKGVDGISRLHIEFIDNEWPL